MPKRKLTGKIVSDKMEKTFVVRVAVLKQDPKYKKRYKSHKNYKAHCERKDDFALGDIVVIEECRPISKDKKWKVIAKKYSKPGAGSQELLPEEMPEER